MVIIQILVAVKLKINNMPLDLELRRLPGRRSHRIFNVERCLKPFSVTEKKRTALLVCVISVNSPLPRIRLQSLIHCISFLTVRLSVCVCVFVAKMTGCEKNPAVSSWEETQLERLTPDTAAVRAAE